MGSLYAFMPAAMVVGEAPNDDDDDDNDDGYLVDDGDEADDEDGDEDMEMRVQDEGAVPDRGNNASKMVQAHSGRDSHHCCQPAILHN